MEPVWARRALSVTPTSSERITAAWSTGKFCSGFAHSVSTLACQALTRSSYSHGAGKGEQGGEPVTAVQQLRHLLKRCDLWATQLSGNLANESRANLDHSVHRAGQVSFPNYSLCFHPRPLPPAPRRLSVRKHTKVPLNQVIEYKSLLCSKSPKTSNNQNNTPSLCPAPRDRPQPNSQTSPHVTLPPGPLSSRRTALVLLLSPASGPLHWLLLCASGVLPQTVKWPVPSPQSHFCCCLGYIFSDSPFLTTLTSCLLSVPLLCFIFLSTLTLQYVFMCLLVCSPPPPPPSTRAAPSRQFCLSCAPLCSWHLRRSGSHKTLSNYLVNEVLSGSLPAPLNKDEGGSAV